MTSYNPILHFGLWGGVSIRRYKVLTIDLTSTPIPHATITIAGVLQPPAAQIFFDLGLEAETSFVGHDGPLHTTPIGTITPITVPWPPSLPVHDKLSKPPPFSILAPLPLRLTAAPNVIAAAAARVRSTPNARTLVSDVVTKYLIGPHDMATIYMSPDPYEQAFEQEINLRKWDLTTHRTAGMCLLEKNGRLLLASIDVSTPAARIARWRTHLRGAWLFLSTARQWRQLQTFQQLSLNTRRVHTHASLSSRTQKLRLTYQTRCKEDFSQFTHDQLNNRLVLTDNGPTFRRKRLDDIVESGDVNNYTTRVMRLTRGRLLKQDDWTDWGFRISPIESV